MAVFYVDVTQPVTVKRTLTYKVEASDWTEAKRQVAEAIDEERVDPSDEEYDQDDNVSDVGSWAVWDLAGYESADAVDFDPMEWWSSSCGRLELQMLRSEAASGSHQGRCDDDVEALSRLPHIAKQLDAMDLERVRADLAGYGAWDEEELADDAQNLQRLLWNACNAITEETRS